MREIKFKAWDDVKSRMYGVGEEDDIVFTMESSGIVAVDITEEEEEFRTLHHLQYFQFTGLTDKHGTEIFEGDIIQWKEVVADYETHCGPNIPTPTNTYTERYDTRVQVCIDRFCIIKGC